MNRDEGSARSNLHRHRTGIHRMGFAPSIAFGLGTNHEVTLSHLWVKTQDRPDYGIRRSPASGRMKVMAKAGNYYGVDGNFDDSETNVSTLNYLFKISPDTQWRTVLRAANYKRAYWAVAGQG